MDAVEDVKAKLSIEDVVGEYVQLKRAGRNWKGLSPFTSEKTPSFIVSPEKQIWHDFSSSKGGDMFSFVMELEGLDFKGALELLARRAGIDLSLYRQGSRHDGPSKERLYELLGLSTKFYQTQFSHNQATLRYVFEQRRFTKETALTWQLGYSPNTGHALTDFLTSRGYTADEMRQAGVTTQRYSGVGDMFRGRLMIPLADAQGRVIGFTARLLADDPKAPKYINTPQTVLYDKSRHVFGLHLAKEAIRKSNFVVVVEGNLDAVASYQAGVLQTVAVAGTALTEQHLKTLSRFTADIRLCFDADRAGVAATERAIPLASKAGVSVSVVDVPAGKDPDELVRQSPEAWREAVIRHKYALDWLIARYTSVLDVGSAQGKRTFTDIILPLVSQLADSVEQDHYLGSISELLGISRTALSTKAALREPKNSRVLRSVKHQPQNFDQQDLEYVKAQDHFLALMLLRPELRHHLATVVPDMFTKQESRNVLVFLQTQPGFIGTPDTEPALIEIADYVKILLLQYDELYHSLDETELAYEASRLTARLVEAYVKHQKQTIALQLGKTDEAQTAALLGRVKQLDELLKQVSGGI